MTSQQQNNLDDVEPNHSLSDVDNQEDDFDDGFEPMQNVNDQSSLLPNPPNPTTNSIEASNMMSSKKEPKTLNAPESSLMPSPSGSVLEDQAINQGNIHQYM